MFRASKLVRPGTRSVLALCIAPLFLAGAIVPAQANTWQYPDSAGDGPRAIDLDLIRVTNSKNAVSVRVRFQDLNKKKVGGSFTNIDTGKRDGRVYFVDMDRRNGKLVTQLLIWKAPDTNPERVRCPAMRVTWKAGGHWREWFGGECSAEFRTTLGDAVVAGTDSATRETIWYTTVTQCMRGLFYVNWKECHRVKFYYDGEDRVWVGCPESSGCKDGYIKWQGWHRCGDSSGIGYSVEVKNCYETRNYITSSYFGISNYDHFTVYVAWKGFPISASYDMHLNVYPSGNYYGHS